MIRYRARAALLVLMALIIGLSGAIPAQAALSVGEVRQLAPATADGMTFSPDGAFVVYTQGSDRSLDVVLKSVDFSGSQEALLSDTLTAEQGILLYEITGDSRRVVALAHPTDRDLATLYSIPIAGGQRASLAPNLPADTAVDFFRVTPDGQQVIFQTRKKSGVSPEVAELFVVPINGSSPPRRLNAALTGIQTVEQWLVSPDGGAVILMIGRSPITIQRAQLSGGVPTTLDTFTLPSGANAQQLIYGVTADGGRVVYRRPTSDTSEQLYVASTSGGGASPVVAPEDVQFFTPLGLTPDSSTVVYAVRFNGGAEGIYAAPLSGSGGFVDLKGSLPAENTSFTGEISPDGERVLVQAFAYTQGRVLASTIMISGTNEVLIPLQAPLGEGIRLSRITPAGTRVVYREGNNFYSMPIAGGAPVRVAANINPNATLPIMLAVTSDDRYMVFRGQVNGEQGYPLFITPLDTADGLQRLSGSIPVLPGPPLLSSGGIPFVMYPSGQWVIFRGTTNANGTSTSLYAVTTGTVPRDQRLFLPLITAR